MGNGHRDNAAARRKIGAAAYAKKAKRRRPKYVGPWNVTFACGQVEYCPLASSSDVSDVVRKQHGIKHTKCEPMKYQRLS
jgi:hypothetical protein